MPERDHEHGLIAVFEDEQSALRAEMREELDHTFVGPGMVRVDTGQPVSTVTTEEQAPEERSSSS